MNARAKQRDEAIAACPVVDQRHARADQAVADACALATAVRDDDPREVWGQMWLWLDEDPLRVLAAVTALAAMVPVDLPVTELLAWVDGPGMHLRAAHAAWVRGERAGWVQMGEKAYQAWRYQQRKQRERATKGAA